MNRRTFFASFLPAVIRPSRMIAEPAQAPAPTVQAWMMTEENGVLTPRLLEIPARVMPTLKPQQVWDIV